MLPFRFSALPRYRFVLATLLMSGAVMATGIFRYVLATADAASTGTGAPIIAADPAPAAGEEQSGTQILLGLAREAIRDGRLVAPAGSNAYEFYLSVLQLAPENPTAQDALRESFGQAAVEIEHTINRGDLDEARREIDLLREFDRNNFTLALLGGKLSAARAIVTKQHEAEAEHIRETMARQAPAPERRHGSAMEPAGQASR
jgi:protein TonB